MFRIKGRVAGLYFFACRLADESYHSRKSTLSYDIGFVGAPSLTPFKGGVLDLDYYALRIESPYGQEHEISRNFQTTRNHKK
jgi:hypothetical protein